MSTDHTGQQIAAPPAKNSKVPAERIATVVTAGIASGVAAQGMYVMFSDSLEMPLPLLFLSFAFIELMVITSAMRARKSLLETGVAGVDGIAMWVLTILSGILAATHAEDLGTLILRLAAPLVAAWGWERSMALERRQLTGKSSGLNLRISPQRLLVKWGLADPTERSAAEIAVERRLAELARAANNLRIARESTNAGRPIRRAEQRLMRALDRAIDDGVVLGDPTTRERLIVHLEGPFSAHKLAQYQPLTDWTSPGGIRDSVAAPAYTVTDDEREEFAAITDGLEREIAARAIDEPAPRAIDTTTDRARDLPDSEDTDRAPIAREHDDRSRANTPAPIARERAETAEPIARDTTDRSRAIDDAARDRASAEAENHTSERRQQQLSDLLAREWAEVGAIQKNRAPIADHIPADLGTDREPIADHSTVAEAAETGTEPQSAREHAAVVSLVRPADRAPIAIEPHTSRAIDSRPDRAQPAREPAVDGALARAIDHAPRAAKADTSIARDRGADAIDRSPFPREISRAQAITLARTVIDRGLSRQPVEVLARIFEARSQGLSPNRIGKDVGLPHSTVGRALGAVEKVAGPRAID
ncbi:hypothetical protein [Nocardia grenadensis]